MSRVNLAKDGCLHTTTVPALEVKHLKGNNRVDNNFPTEVAEIDCFLCHVCC